MTLQPENFAFERAEDDRIDFQIIQKTEKIIFMYMIISGKEKPP